MKFFSVCFVIITLFGFTLAFAQTKKAMVINQGALVYTQADFDAPVLTELPAGGVYDISAKTKGPFYKIRLRPNVTGWIADIDVRPGKFKGAKPGLKGGRKGSRNAPPAGGKVGATEKTPSDEAAALEKSAEAKARKKSFMATRFRGPVVSYIAYGEDTMGGLHTQNLPFFGVKLEGPNVVISGDIRTDAEFIFHPGAPEYYQKATGQSATGWIFLSDFVFETAFPQSPWHTVSIGFGPMFKYTHYEVALLENGRPLSYSLDDMAVGAVFDGGLAFRTGAYALRFNLKYYWEKTKYWGGSVTFGFPF